MVDGITSAPQTVALGGVNRNDRWRSLLRFVADPKAAVAVSVLLTLTIVAILAPLLAHYGENEQNPATSLVGVSWAHPLGTDRLGRDIFSRMIYGSRVSLRMAAISVSVAMAIGVPWGLVSGYRGGWVDEVLMRVVDAMIAFPNLIFMLAIVAILGPGLNNIMIAIGLNSFPIFARLIRAQTLSLRGQDFVLAAA